MEREHIFLGLLLISFFLLLPTVPAPSAVPIDNFCGDGSPCVNMCTSQTTYVEYACQDGYCQPLLGEQTCPSGLFCNIVDEQGIASILAGDGTEANSCPDVFNRDIKAK